MVGVRTPRDRLKVEVAGIVSSVSLAPAGTDTTRALITTLNSGAHMLVVDERQSLEEAEKFDQATFLPERPGHVVTASTLLDNCHAAFGTHMGAISVLDCEHRQSLVGNGMTGRIKRICAMEDAGAACLLACTNSRVSMIDVRRPTVTAFLTGTVQIADTVVLSHERLAVATTKGVMLFDVRKLEPLQVFDVPTDQLTTIARVDSSSVVCGSVGGRVFTMRSGAGTTRDRVVAMPSDSRSPVTAVAAVHRNVLVGTANGMIASLGAMEENEAETLYWTVPDRVVVGIAHQQIMCSSCFCSPTANTPQIPRHVRHV